MEIAGSDTIHGPLLGVLGRRGAADLIRFFLSHPVLAPQLDVDRVSPHSGRTAVITDASVPV